MTPEENDEVFDGNDLTNSSKNKISFKYNSEIYRWESSDPGIWIKVRPFASENLETRIILHLHERRFAFEARCEVREVNFDPEGYHTVGGERKEPDEYWKPGYWEYEIDWDLYGIYYWFAGPDRARFKSAAELRQGVQFVEAVLWQCSPHIRDIPFKVTNVSFSGKLSDLYERGEF